ncbi:Endoribonuclease YbeY [Galemys pyrenaicus]|uniref:Endoribonuclease YbeY n=1 Tax=Galemys pyrenaicus TaxID=202257 RepID=A0A8J6ACM5_GALPY|nr:Endoribonuclease YbeY [Galemys pyrenaicus]
MQDKSAARAPGGRYFVARRRPGGVGRARDRGPEAAARAPGPRYNVTAAPAAPRPPPPAAAGSRLSPAAPPGAPGRRHPPAARRARRRGAPASGPPPPARRAPRRRARVPLPPRAARGTSGPRPPARAGRDGRAHARARPAMTLVLRNLQRAVPLRRAPLRRGLEAARAALGVRAFDLALVCVDDARMRRLNRRYRGRDLPTDVLAFPFLEDLAAGEIPRPARREDHNLGDIVLGVEFVLRHCGEDEDFYGALTVTATHGLCHLLGFTHSTEAEWRKVGLPLRTWGHQGHPPTRAGHTAGADGSCVVL